MILNEASREELKQIIAAFKKHPLIKEIAKTPMDGINDLIKGFSRSQSETIFRLLRAVMKSPEIKSFIIGRISGHPDTFNADFRENHISAYVWMVKDFISIGSRAARGDLSKDARDALSEWVNSNHGTSMSEWVASELRSIPDIRPDKPVLVFRGVLFNQNQTAADYRPFVEWRTPKPFIEALMSGKDLMMMNQPKPSSWSYSKDIATKFATSKAASNHHGAMTNWLQSVKSKSAIQGELGLLLATIARPDEIICDLSMVNINRSFNHGDEKELILDSGNRRVKIVAIWTPRGVVSVEEFQQHMAEKDNTN